MGNRNTILLLLLFVVLGAGYWLVSRNPWRTVAKPADAFAIEDTAAITKIFLANKRGQKILLERNSNQSWTVNGRFLADEPKIRLLLGTLHDLRIQLPIPESMHNTAMGILASVGIKTEIYAGDQLIQTLYVGSETPDKTGTFMLLEGEDEPYSIHIPGFVGFLTPRFFLSEIKWRNKLLFDIPYHQLQQVEITYPGNPSHSFQYDYALFNSLGKILNAAKRPVDADTQQVKYFAHAFLQKYVEGYYEDSTFTPAERDSLFQLNPYCIIRYRTFNEKEKDFTVTLYYKPLGGRTKERYDEQGRLLDIDPEKFYARIDGIPQVASVQEYALRPILRKAGELIR